MSFKLFFSCSYLWFKSVISVFVVGMFALVCGVRKMCWWKLSVDMDCPRIIFYFIPHFMHMGEIFLVFLSCSTTSKYVPSKICANFFFSMRCVSDFIWRRYIKGSFIHLLKLLHRPSQKRGDYISDCVKPHLQELSDTVHCARTSSHSSQGITSHFFTTPVSCVTKNVSLIPLFRNPTMAGHGHVIWLTFIPILSLPISFFLFSQTRIAFAVQNAIWDAITSWFNDSFEV